MKPVVPDHGVHAVLDAPRQVVHHGVRVGEVDHHLRRLGRRTVVADVQPGHQLQVWRRLDGSAHLGAHPTGGPEHAHRDLGFGHERSLSGVQERSGGHVLVLRIATNERDRGARDRGARSATINTASALLTWVHDGQPVDGTNLPAQSRPAAECERPDHQRARTVSSCRRGTLGPTTPSTGPATNSCCAISCTCSALTAS